MAETRQTIRERVQVFVGTAINATLNEAIKKAHKELQRKHSYRFMETSSTISVSEGDTTFALPSDFKEVVNPEMSDDEGTGFVRMKGVIKAGIDSRDTSEEGRPLLFRIWGGTGYLYAQADQDYTFNLEYIRWITEPSDNEYTSDDNAQSFIDECYDFHEYKALAAGYRRLNKFDSAKEYEQLAQVKRLELEHDDIGIALAGIDLKMELPG
jgi:hypothetical protein